MAGVIPNIPGTGNNVPVSTFTAGISESYPNVNRQRVVESSINSKERIDFLPVNMGVNSILSDRYLEFRINGTIGSFLDLSSLLLEMNVKPVVSATNADLAADLNVALVNGMGNTLFKNITVFINEKMVESNPLYNYTSYIKLLKSMNKENIGTIGKCCYFYDDANNGEVTKNYVAATFSTAGNIENTLMTSLKSSGVDLCFPLLTDISSLDMYLLDGVDVRIRLELANNSWLVKSDGDVSGVNLKVNKAKLWLDRVTPHYNALTALNQSLALKPVEYIFNKTLHKTYVVGSGENSIMIDQPFGMVVPEKLSMVIVSMDSYSGNNAQNGLYFDHANISNIHVTLNGNTVYNFNTSFPHVYSQCYYEIQKAIGIDKDNMITYDSFKNGRSVFTFNFVDEPTEETLPVESSASLRINLKFGQNLTRPHVIILLADTTGLLSVDNQRFVSCDVRG